MMTGYQWIAVTCAIALWLASTSTAKAQGFFGVGIGSGWGSGIGGFFGGGSRGFAGVGATIVPRPVVRPSELSMPARQEIIANGQVTGLISGCPEGEEKTTKGCSMPSELIRQMVINAIPESDRQQWVSTQPNAQGLYQLQLPPGRYMLTVHTPEGSGIQYEKAAITVHSGRQIVKDLRLDHSR